MVDSPLILVVDDSPIQRKIYAATLKTAGYSVLVAENGRAGVAVALDSHPALILMDVPSASCAVTRKWTTCRSWP
jgi:CheY-like chemotaxis protein